MTPAGSGWSGWFLKSESLGRGPTSILRSTYYSMRILVWCAAVVIFKVVLFKRALIKRLFLGPDAANGEPC
jgi:hypothetical protein